MLTIEQRLHMLQRPTGMIDLVVDTDAYNEIDDQFAISYAMRAKDKLNLLALYAAPFHNSRSTSAEDGMVKSYEEILKLLHLAGESYPVYEGSRTYLPDETKAAAYRNYYAAYRKIYDAVRPIIEEASK
jgi:hypothetical protein